MNKAYNISFWETESFLKPVDVIIVGGGIVGISTAITIKEKRPDLSVTIIDSNTFPLGASTRNAGFSCFGSVTELLDDLESTSEEAVFELLGERIRGLEILKERLGVENIDYKHCGAFELFSDEDQNIEKYRDKLDYLNDRIFQVSGLTNTFSTNHTLEFAFPGFNQFNIFNRHEGQLHPGKMMESLYSKANLLDVKFLMGHNIEAIEESGHNALIIGKNFTLKGKHTIICSNGFTKHLLPELKILPARNQVLLTEEIENLDWNACFHYDRGYVYFRNVGKRILIGGARNIDSSNETTSDFALTDYISSHLLRFLHEKIGVDRDIKIAHKWSGIMGVGDVKSPIVKKHSEHIILAVRLGGMGVALGSLVGEKAANLLLDSVI